MVQKCRVYVSSGEKSNADKQPQHTHTLYQKEDALTAQNTYSCRILFLLQLDADIFTRASEAFPPVQCSPSHGSTLACSLEISPPPSRLPLHHAPRWSPVPLHSLLPLPLAQPSRSIWPMTRARATTSLQVIWPPVKSRVRLGGSGSLTDPFSVSFFFRTPPCQQLSHLSQVFIEGGAYPLNTSLLCQVSVYNSSFSLSFSSSGTHYLCLCCRIPQL